MPFPWLPSCSELRIGALDRRTTDRGTRISACVHGRQVWFESDGIELTDAPEAYGSLMLIPALHAGKRLVVDSPVCSVWAANVRKAVPLVSGWWRYQPLVPELCESTVAPKAATETALCFSGGADSFHTLLHGPRRTDLLVHGMGYDVRRRDGERVRMVEHSVRSVAAEIGVKCAIITSNLRDHRLVRFATWERAHGGALFALGHLLRDSVSHLLVSSSYERKLACPWGSRWDLDPLFSSGGMAVEHFGAEFGKAQKLEAIAKEKVVHKYLRVCMGHPPGRLNCGECIKCLLTMLRLERFGQLAKCDCFARGERLIDAIDRFPCVTGSYASLFRSLLEEGLPSGPESAVRRLLARSESAASQTGQQSLWRRGLRWRPRFLRRMLGRPYRQVIAENGTLYANAVSAYNAAQVAQETSHSL